MSLADQLHEAMDPEVAAAKAALDSANKAWKVASDEWQKAQAMASVLKTVAERVDGTYRRTQETPQEAWKWALAGKNPRVIGYFASDKKLPRYTRKTVKAGELVPTKQEIAYAEAEAKRLSAKAEEGRAAYSAADKVYREATGAARRAAKQKKDLALGKAICQSCFGGYNYTPGDGTLVKHGWKEAGGRRKGYRGMTWHTGACAGTGKPPFQVSKDYTEHEIAEYGKALKSLRAMQVDKVSTEAELRQPKYAEGNGNSFVFGAISKIKDPAAREKAIPRAIEMVTGGVQAELDLSKSMVKRWKRDDAWIQRTNWPKKPK